MKRAFQFKMVIAILTISIVTPVVLGQADWTVKSSANSELANNIVRKLYQDSHGKIWVGTANGLNIIDNDSWETFTKADGLPHKIVWDIGEDSKGNIWVATVKGIALFDGKDWSYFNKDDGIAHNKVFALEMDSKGNVWLGTKKGVSMFDGENWKTYTMSEGLVNNVVIDIMEDGSGNMWFATRRGVSIYDGENWTSFDIKDGLTRNFVWSLAEDSKGTIWFGTHTGAFSKYDGANWETIKKGSGYYDYTGLIGGIANGIVWTIALGPAVGATMFVVFTVWGAFPSANHYTSVYIDSDEKVWLAAQPKGVFMFDGQNWMQYNNKNGLPHNRVFDMLEMENGEMWFGTSKGIAIMKQ